MKENEEHLEAALSSAEEAGRAYVKTPIPDARPIEALKANVYLKRGRLALAQDWARARGLSADDEVSYLGEFEHLTLARVLMAEYQTHQSTQAFLQAVGLLERLLKAAEAQRRTGSVIEILVAQAVAHQVVARVASDDPKYRGNMPLALASLERALTLAEPEGYFRLFVDEGEPMCSLLLDLRARMKQQPSGQNHPLLVYVERLLTGFGRTEANHAITQPKKVGLMEPAPHIEPAPLIEALSERELEVLKLLRTECKRPRNCRSIGHFAKYFSHAHEKHLAHV